ncbi:hypothetical protein HRbin12_00251 [bacterium HR12]|nr:hypothetical protein HRbin12_00251 [bacterium HR12]
MFPADFAIFWPTIRRWPPWTQRETTWCPVAPSDCAISSSWWGKIRSTPPVWMSKRSPRYFMDIAEHSMCHPGNPSPHGLSHFMRRPGPAFFHRAKSAWKRLFGSISRSCRYPARSCSRVLPESFPYSGKDWTSK